MDIRDRWAWTAGVGKAHLHILDHNDPHGSYEALISCHCFTNSKEARGVDTDTSGEAPALVKEVRKRGGFTIHDHRGDAPTSGYMVALRKDTEHKVPKQDFRPHHIDEYREAHREDLDHPNHYLGSWVHKGHVYLDVSKHHQDREEAMDHARDARQKAVFNLDEMDEEPTEKATKKTKVGYRVLSKTSDPINDMIYVNEIRREAGLPPLGLNDL
jgi:hypothetical protein